MRIKAVFFIVLFVFAAVSCFSYQAEKKLSLDAAGLEELEIECGAGFLKVKGVDGSNTIDVKANIVLKGIDEDDVKSFIEDNVTLTLEKKGNDAILVGKVEFSGISSIFKRKEARIDLEVSMPKTLKLSVDDGSGSLTVSNLSAGVKIEDGSGNIDIDNIGGNLGIDDGSGSIKVENVGGDVEVEDGSGEINLEKIKGNVDVDDSSGEINIRDVGGSVVVGDGSGSIYIDGVEKDVYIKDDGSGSVKILNVKGKVKK